MPALKDAKKLSVVGQKEKAQELLAVLATDPFQNPPGEAEIQTACFQAHWEGPARSGLFCWGVLAWPIARWAARGAAAPPPALKAASVAEG